MAKTQTKAEPISPEQVLARKQFNPTLIECVNRLLVKRFDGKSAIIKLKEIRKEFEEANPDGEWTWDRLVSEHHLDFEDLYREAGWKVEYDKPAYNENYSSYFKFKPNKNRK